MLLKVIIEKHSQLINISLMAWNRLSIFRWYLPQPVQEEAALELSLKEFPGVRGEEICDSKKLLTIDPILPQLWLAEELTDPWPPRAK